MVPVVMTIADFWTGLEADRDVLDPKNRRFPAAAIEEFVLKSNLGDPNRFFSPGGPPELSVGLPGTPGGLPEAPGT